MEHAASNDSAATVASKSDADEVKDSNESMDAENANEEDEEKSDKNDGESKNGKTIELMGLRSELGDAWKPAELPDDVKDSNTETSQQDNSSSRRSKRIRKKKETFVPETRGFFKSHSRASSKQSLPRGESNQSTSSPPEGDAPWGILPPPLEEEQWEEAVLSQENVMGQDAQTIGQVVSAVGKQLSRDPNRTKIDWNAISKKLKVKRVSLSSSLCQAIWRLAAYKITPRGEITDRKIRKRRTLEASSVKDDDSDLDEIPLLPGSKMCRDLDGVRLSRYFPEPPYSRYSNEEAWEDTGLKKIFMDQQCLPSYSWKNEDDFNLVTAVLATNSIDWDKIKEASHLVDLRMLSRDTLKKRFLRLEKNIRDERYKCPKVLERMALLNKTYPELVRRIVSRG
mmetsp:Transcript_20021/g.38613  ORF Transcript_20021/g.38613 Transcript_20021/m.38613 type:complete len:397 (-) Transcript_20021:75-1265(-)